MFDCLEEFDRVFVSHMSIIRLLEELSRTNNPKIRILLDYLKASQKVLIYSAGFKSQIDVRNATEYFEPASAVAVALEKDCTMIYGEPVVDDKLVSHFGNRIIRINEFCALRELN